jgi:hypothetical protein
LRRCSDRPRREDARPQLAGGRLRPPPAVGPAGGLKDRQQPQVARDSR